MSEDIRFCSDCKWSKEVKHPQDKHFKILKCAHPTQLDLVTGEIHQGCTSVRYSVDCGRDEAKLWEPKPQVQRKFPFFPIFKLPKGMFK